MIIVVNQTQKAAISHRYFYEHKTNIIYKICSTNLFYIFRPATSGGFALIFGFVIGLVVVCGGGCYFCIKHGEQCCRQIGHCCSSIAKLCNSLGGIGKP